MRSVVTSLSFVERKCLAFDVRLRLLTGALVVFAALGTLGADAASGMSDLTGTWSCCGAGGAAA